MSKREQPHRLSRTHSHSHSHSHSHNHSHSRNQIVILIVIESALPTVFSPLPGGVPNGRVRGAGGAAPARPAALAPQHTHPPARIIHSMTNERVTVASSLRSQGRLKMLHMAHAPRETRRHSARFAPSAESCSP